MKRHFALLALLALLTSVATAQNQQQSGPMDTVIITSSNSTQDTLTASGPSEKLGIPILHTANSTLPEATSNSLELLQPSNIVILGGPEAVSANIETELSNYANSTTRIWGETATSTSIKTSQYYWPEGNNDTAVVHVPNQTEQTGQLLSLVREIEAGKPILISQGENISGDVMGELDRLGPNQVTLYSTQTEEFNTSQIEQLGVEQVQTRQGELQNISSSLKQQQASEIVQNIGSNDTLILAAGQEDGGIVTVPYLDELYVYGIQDETQINTAAGLVQAVPASEIWVTGEPELVNDVITIVEDVTQKDLETIEGSKLEIMEQVIQRQLGSIFTVQDRLHTQWMEDIENTTQLQVSASSQLEETRTLVGQNAPQEAQELLNRSETAYEEGNYFEARKLALQASSQVRMENYMATANMTQG